MRKQLYEKLVAGALIGAMMMSMVGCGKGYDKEQNPPKTEEDMTVIDDGMYVEGDYALQETCADVTGYPMTNGHNAYPMTNEFDVPYNTNEYNDYKENSWMSVASSPLSTFAADVDTASYSQIRSYINEGYEIDPGMVRLEEMINYFHYDYDKPKGDDKFGVCTEYMDCPWNKDTKLALVSLSTEEIDFSEAPASNLVFLVDTSGSMFDSNKLPLAQQSLCMIAENLTEKDCISIVTYAGEDTVVLEGASGDDYYTICDAIETMEADGSTNGSAGIKTAYRIAEEHFIEGGNNRVILMTDGDLNVGVTSESGLERLISEEKETGVFLSIMGFGYGNYKDTKLETLADKGNGNYAYIDTIYEAKKALVDDMGANFVTVAKDVKLQVEFNPEHVKGYRLLGYENRVMAAEDFADDTKDGGEMGAGHTVTALYEIALVDSEFDINTPDLKYDHDKQAEDVTRTSDISDMDIFSRIKEAASYEDEIFTVNVRYKEIDSNESTLDSFSCTVDHYSKDGSDNIRFAAAVAAFGMYLKDSEYKGTVNQEMIISLAKSTKDFETDEYKQEFVNLVERSRYCD